MCRFLSWTYTKDVLDITETDLYSGLTLEEYLPSCPYVVTSSEVKLEDLELNEGTDLHVVARKMVIKLKLAKR